MCQGLGRVKVQIMTPCRTKVQILTPSQYKSSNTDTGNTHNAQEAQGITYFFFLVFVSTRRKRKACASRPFARPCRSSARCRRCFCACKASKLSSQLRGVCQSLFELDNSARCRRCASWKCALLSQFTTQCTTHLLAY